MVFQMKSNSCCSFGFVIFVFCLPLFYVAYQILPFNYTHILSNTFSLKTVKSTSTPLTVWSTQTPQTLYCPPHPSLPQQNLTVVKNRRNNMWGRGRIDNMAIIKCYKCQNIMLGNRRHVFNKKIYGSNWSN